MSFKQVNSRRADVQLKYNGKLARDRVTVKELEINVIKGLTRANIELWKDNQESSERPIALDSQVNFEDFPVRCHYHISLIVETQTYYSDPRY